MPSVRHLESMAVDFWNVKFYLIKVLKVPTQCLCSVQSKCRSFRRRDCSASYTDMKRNPGKVITGLFINSLVIVKTAKCKASLIKRIFRLIMPSFKIGWFNHILPVINLIWKRGSIREEYKNEFLAFFSPFFILKMHILWVSRLVAGSGVLL